MRITSAAPLPPDEAERLLTLHHYAIAASLKEAVFTEFVGLAARIFNLPISLLALVGADEVTYEAAHGLPGLRYQQRQEAICSRVIAENQVVVFTDTAQALAPQLPTPTSLAALVNGLRFYAGAPLRMPNQAVIGTLCVLDRVPHAFGPPERQVLEQLAGLVARIVVVRHSCLTSRWLGQDYWQLTQAHIADALRQLPALPGAAAPAGQPGAVPNQELQRTIGHLNELGWVLAEPLPGFA